MAEATIKVNAGAGPDIDFRTVGALLDKYRQVVVLGSPSDKDGVAPVDLTYGVGTDVKRLPAGSFGDPTDAEAAGNGSLIAITKRVRTILGNGVTAQITSLPTDRQTGANITGVGQAFTVYSSGRAAVRIDISGTFVGTLLLEGTLDDTAWFAIGGHNGTSVVTSVTAAAQLIVPTSGLYGVRIRSTSFSSGTAACYADQGFMPVSVFTYPFPPGDNNIGNVDIVTVPADPFGTIADAIVAAGATGSFSAKLRRTTQGLEDLKTLISLAAGAALIGKTASGLGTDVLYNGTTALTPKFASISRATNADGAAVVNLVSSKKIRVVAYDLVVIGAVGVKWQSSTSNSTGAGVNTDLCGLKSFAANGGEVKGFNPLGYFETVAGEALKLNLNAAVQVSGELTYVEV